MKLLNLLHNYRLESIVRTEVTPHNVWLEDATIDGPDKTDALIEGKRVSTLLRIWRAV